jgi:hypothetical protein
MERRRNVIVHRVVHQQLRAVDAVALTRRKQELHSQLLHVNDAIKEQQTLLHVRCVCL